MNGLIGKIQRYSTKDGPGIRTTVFMVGCNLRCKWCANPELLKADQVMYHKEKCHHCGSCLAYEGIQWDTTGVKINRSQCKKIKELEEICPFEAYENVGKWMGSDELVQILLKDKEYYSQSNGGVTFSGGEALLQADFVYECTKKLHEYGIHVTLDTACALPYHPVLDEVDLILLDIKAYDALLHKKCTGIKNDQILENAKKIRKPVIVRMVLVPEFNDELEDIKKRIDFASTIHCIQIDFLKYHILGVSKYEQLGLSYECSLKELDETILQSAIKYAEEKHIEYTIGG